MKEEIHPQNFRKVIFLDTTSGEKFLFSSTIDTDETGEWEDGEEYPLARIEMSSASHPFYTGVETVVDTAGRVEKFEARFEKAEKKQAEKQSQDQEEAEDEEAEEESEDDEVSQESADKEEES